MTPATMFMDVTTDFGGGYVPTDADRLERGPTPPALGAPVLAEHPAVKAALISTPDHVFDMAKRFGIEFQSKTNQAGGSIALGTLEVHPVDLTSAYGAIANGGVLMPRTTITKIIDREGKQYYPDENAEVRRHQGRQPPGGVPDDRHPARQHRSRHQPLLGQVQRRSRWQARPGRPQDRHDERHQGPVRVRLRRPVQGQGRPAIAIGVWMGNSDNSKTKGVFPLESTAPLFESFLEDALKNEKVGTFERPDGLVEAQVDAFSGLRRPVQLRDRDRDVHRRHGPSKRWSSPCRR